MILRVKLFIRDLQDMKPKVSGWACMKHKNEHIN